ASPRAREEEPAHATENERDADLVQQAIGRVLVRLPVEAQRLRPPFAHSAPELGMPPAPVALDEPRARGKHGHAGPLEPDREPGHAEPREHHATFRFTPSAHASPPARGYSDPASAAAPTGDRAERPGAGRLARASQNSGRTACGRTPFSARPTRPSP